MSQPNDDPLLRSVMRAAAATGPDGVCPDADVLALYAEQELDADERVSVDTHVTTCGRCQEALAAFAKSAPEDSSAVTLGAPSPWWAGWRWLMPLAASGAVLTVALWIGSRPGEQLAESSRTASAPVDGFQQPSPPATAVADVAKEVSLRDQLSRSPTPAAQTAANAVVRQDAPLAKAVEPATAPPALTVAAPPASFRAADAVAPAGELKAERRNAETPAAVGGQFAEVTREVRPIPAAPAEADKPSAPRPPQDLGRTRQALEASASAPAPPPASVNRPPQSGAAVGAAQATGGPARRLESGADAKAESALAFAGDERLQVSGSWRLRGAVVERTRDQGQTWHTSSLAPGVQPVALASPSPLVCWVVGARAVLRTLDGTTWARVSAPSDDSLVGISATDARRAVVTTAAGAKFATVDGGVTWRRVQGQSPGVIGPAPRD